jgi:lycopene cyclase domain-containing protein
MTYFGFLAIFLGLPLAGLAVLTWHDARRGLVLPLAWRSAPVWLVLAVHVALAVLWTTPWDNYLVATRVWYYDPARVSGLRLGWVPIEEYSFFVLQTILAGAWLLWLVRHLPPVPITRRPAGLRLLAAGLGVALWLSAALTLALGWEPGTYLALICVWLLPPVILQLAVGADLLAVLWPHVCLGITVPALFLSTADAFALGVGVWTIDPAQSTGLRVGSLPIEEFFFFAITNMLIVFGMTLMLAGGRELLARLPWLGSAGDARQRPEGTRTG